MEQRWFVWGFLGEPVAEPWGDWTVDEPWDEDADGPLVRRAGDVTAEELVERLRAIGERTRSVLRDFPLDATASPGGRFADDPPSLEWICFHVLAEYARHAGHLDIAVELAASKDRGPGNEKGPVRRVPPERRTGSSLPEDSDAPHRVTAFVPSRW